MMNYCHNFLESLPAIALCLNLSILIYRAVQTILIVLNYLRSINARYGAHFNSSSVRQMLREILTIKYFNLSPAELCMPTTDSTFKHNFRIIVLDS